MLTAILRTVVPALWGSFIAWLVGLLPLLAPFQSDLTGLADIALPVITAVIIGAWYAFWRWLEPRLPDWLTRAVLGSAKTPTYGTADSGPKHSTDTPAPVINNFTIHSTGDPQATADQVARHINQFGP